MDEEEGQEAYVPCRSKASICLLSTRNATQNLQDQARSTDDLLANLEALLSTKRNCMMAPMAGTAPKPEPPKLPPLKLPVLRLPSFKAGSATPSPRQAPLSSARQTLHTSTICFDGGGPPPSVRFTAVGSADKMTDPAYLTLASPRARAEAAGLIWDGTRVLSSSLGLLSSKQSKQDMVAATTFTPSTQDSLRLGSRMTQLHSCPGAPSHQLQPASSPRPAVRSVATASLTPAALAVTKTGSSVAPQQVAARAAPLSPHVKRSSSFKALTRDTRAGSQGLSAATTPRSLGSVNGSVLKTSAAGPGVVRMQG